MNARVALSEDLLELEVAEVWRRLLRCDDVGLDDDFFDLGGDSITAVQLLMELETLGGQPYPESELGLLTVRRIAEVLKTHRPPERRCVTQAKAGSALAPFQAELQSEDLWTRLRAVRRMARTLKGSEQAPTACVNPASGIPLFFCHGDFQARGIYAHQLAALLPEDQPVYLLHPETLPAVGTTVEDLAGRYLEEVRRIAPGMPVMLGGYCNGGYVAWHLAHLLRSRGIEVTGLLLVETPSINAWPMMRVLGALLRHSPRLRELAMRAVRNLYRHGIKHFIARAWRAARDRVSPPGTPDYWWTLVRGMSARYVPPPLDVDVYCFLAEEEDRRETEPAHWLALAPRVTELTVPGDHLSAVIDHRQTLAAAFAAVMREAARRQLPADAAAPTRSKSRGAPAARAV